MAQPPSAVFNGPIYFEVDATSSARDSSDGVKNTGFKGLRLDGTEVDQASFLAMLQNAVGPDVLLSLDAKGYVGAKVGEPSDHPILQVIQSAANVVATLSDTDSAGDRIALATYDLTDVGNVTVSVGDFSQLATHQNAGIATQQAMLARVLTTTLQLANKLSLEQARTAGIQAEATILAAMYGGIAWRSEHSFWDPSAAEPTAVLVYNLDGTALRRGTTLSFDAKWNLSGVDVVVVSDLTAQFVVNGCSASPSGLCTLTPQLGELLVEPLAGDEKLAFVEYLATDPTGNVYVSDGDFAFQIGAGGITQGYANELLSGFQALAYDARNEQVYVAVASGPKGLPAVAVFDVGGGLSRVIDLPAGTEKSLAGLALSADGTTLYASDHFAGTIVRVRVSDGLALGSFSVGSDPAGIVVDPGGNLYVAVNTNERILEFTPGGTLVGTFLASTGSVWGIAGWPRGPFPFGPLSASTQLAIAAGDVLLFTAGDSLPTVLANSAFFASAVGRISSITTLSGAEGGVFSPFLESPCTTCNCGGDTGDDVYGFSGECHEDFEDLQIPGRSPDFVWARKYRSRIGPNTAQGNGWDFSYNIFLESSGADLLLHDGNTRVDAYLRQGDGTWVATGFFRAFTENPDGTFTLTFEDTGRWVFHPLDGSSQQGKIKSIIDRNGNGQTAHIGNRLTFDYDVLGRLMAIHDTIDNPPTNPRVITVAYNTDGFIESVTDFTGRSVTYEYYLGLCTDGSSCSVAAQDCADASTCVAQTTGDGSFGDLKSVTTPIVVNTADFPIPPGHEYPSGKTTVYTYSTGFADDRLNHNLLTIIDPKGQQYRTTTYSPTQDPTDLNFDRVVRQVWGNHGDIIDYVYVAQFPSLGNNFAVSKTIVNDRVGNVTEDFFDGLNRAGVHREYTGRWDPDLPTTDADLANPPIPRLRPADPPFFETRWEYNADSLSTRMIHPNLNEVVSTYDEANPGRRSQGNLLTQCRVPGPLGGDQVQICETYEYDDDFGSCCGSNFVTRHVDGRGNDTLHTYDANGNRTHTRERKPSIVEDFEYNTFGQMTAHILPDNGSVHRRRDEFTYHDAGPQLGYLKDEIVDAPGFALTTTYEYNPVGQVTRVTDARRHDTQYTVNQLHQVVRRISREVANGGVSRESAGGGVRYERQTFYDPNDNVVRVDIQNKDDAGVLQPNEHFTSVYEYDILNYQTKTCQEVGDYTAAIPGTQQVPLCTGLPDADFLSTEYAYDANRNRTLTRFGEAVEGRQPTNMVRTLYDERDLVFRTIRAEGDPDKSTTQYDYDGNENRKRVSQGIEDVAAPRITINNYDGYDRMVTSTDPMGNITEYHYDPNSNLGGFQDPAETIPNPFGTRRSGELIDVPGSAGNVRLKQMTYVYDKLDRIIQKEVEFFDTDTQTPILILGVPTPGKATTLTEWSDNSQILLGVNDNNHQTMITYDTVNRQDVVADHLSNTTTYAYDANSNVTALADVEKSDLLAPDELFTTTYAYDGLDRHTQAVDNVGNTLTSAYDSRNNRTVMVDALNNETRHVYDGINRLVKTVRDLNGDGANASAVPGDGDPDIVTTRALDDTSRLVGQTDDNGNTTAYTFDALNRITAEEYADSTSNTVTFDVHHNQLTRIDANGSVVESADPVDYDLLNRLTRRDITPGAGVSDAITFENYQYDGLSRFVRTEDDDSVVSRSHDSLSRVTRETLNGQTTVCLYDGVGNELTSTYPGGRVIECTYDELERKKSIVDETGMASQPIADYAYIGPERVQRREYGNGTRTDYAYDGITGIVNPTNDFGVKRVIGTTHTKIADGSVIDDRTYTWDKMNNKTQRKDIRSGGPRLTHDYTYDSAVYRLVRTAVTDAAAAVIRVADYGLDGVGNRQNVTGAPDPGQYTMSDVLTEPADRQMNQYTTTPTDPRGYDKNGNLTRIGLADTNLDGLVNLAEWAAFSACLQGPGVPVSPSCDDFDLDASGTVDLRDVAQVQNAFGRSAGISYDYRNQMVEYRDLTTGQRHTYAYDAFGRRIAKIVDADATPSPSQGKGQGEGSIDNRQSAIGNPLETRYFYDGWQVCEEQDTLGATQATYVYGLYVDEALNMQRGGTDYYYHTDDLYNVMAVTDPSAAVVERYEYADYGQPVDPNTGIAIVNPQSSIGNPYRFTGRRFDSETGWYHYRTRYLDPIVGRFTTRDVIGIWGDQVNLGNGYTYVGDRPVSYTDPYGLKLCCQTEMKLYLAMGYPDPWDCAGDFWAAMNLEFLSRVSNTAMAAVAVGTPLWGAATWVASGITSTVLGASAALTGVVTAGMQAGLYAGGLVICNSDVCTLAGTSVGKKCCAPFYALTYAKFDKFAVAFFSGSQDPNQVMTATPPLPGAPPGGTIPYTPQPPPPTLADTLHEWFVYVVPFTSPGGGF